MSEVSNIGNVGAIRPGNLNKNQLRQALLLLRSYTQGVSPQGNTEREIISTIDDILNNPSRYNNPSSIIQRFRAMSKEAQFAVLESDLPNVISQNRGGANGTAAATALQRLITSNRQVF